MAGRDFLIYLFALDGCKKEMRLLTGQVIDHVGIHVSEAAEGFSAFNISLITIKLRNFCLLSDEITGK